MESLTHSGPFTPKSRESPVLRFLERYFRLLESLDFTTMATTTFHAPSSEFYDSKGDVTLGREAIWKRIKQLLGPFCYIHHQIVEIRVISMPNQAATVYVELLLRMILKVDTEEIVCPSFCVFKVGEMKMEEAKAGFWIEETKCFWDTGILGRYVTGKRRREEIITADNTGEGPSKRRSTLPDVTSGKP
jgi:hypothetical protein